MRIPNLSHPNRRSRSPHPAQLFLLALLGLSLAGCGGRIVSERDGPGEHRDVSRVPDAVPRVEPHSRGGNPVSYVVFGKRYHTLKTSSGFVERGIASWYGKKFHGRKTSNGETYDMYTMTAAHKRLPLPTYVEVVNLENGRSVVVRVNDRGPFHENRVIDLSYAAASRIGMLGKGTALVEVRAIDPRAPQRPPLVVASRSPTVETAAASPAPASPTPPARRPAAPPAATQQAASAPRIFLQAGAFSSSSNAERLRDRLERRLARRVRVEQGLATGSQVHRVQVGPLASVEIADQVALEMHGLGIGEPLVVID
jgi:rare lipoprotein A